MIGKNVQQGKFLWIIVSIFHSHDVETKIDGFFQCIARSCSNADRTDQQCAHSVKVTMVKIAEKPYSTISTLYTLNLPAPSESIASWLYSPFFQKLLFFTKTPTYTNKEKEPIAKLPLLFELVGMQILNCVFLGHCAKNTDRFYQSFRRKKQ